MRFLAAAVLALACAPGPARAGAAEGASLSAQQAALAQAVRRGDAAALRAAATRRGRVLVDLHGPGDPHGSYGPGQLQVVLERIFEMFETRSFVFENDDEEGEEGGDKHGGHGHATGIAFARGAWVRRPRGGGDEVQDTLTFVLRQEEGGWRIVEIRSSP